MALKNFLTQLSVRLTSQDSIYRFSNASSIPVNLDNHNLTNDIIAISEFTSKFQTKHPILCVFPQSSDFIASLFGCMFAKSIPICVSLPRSSNWDSVANIIGDSKSELILTSKGFSKAIQRFLVRYHLENRIHIQIVEELDSNNDILRVPDISMSDVAILQYTSGSTSKPKAVDISYNNLQSNLELIHHKFKLSNTRIMASWLPFYHDMGLIGHIFQPVFSNLTSIIMPNRKFLANPKCWLKIISDNRVEVSGAPNFAYKYCIDKIRDDDLKDLDLSSWKVAYSGSERISVEIVREFFNKFKSVGLKENAFFAAYGLAESTVFVTGRFGLKMDSKECVCVGPVDRRIGIINLEVINPLNLLDEDCLGEIVVTGKSNTEGYFRKPELSESLFADIRGEKFLRTGDIGYVNNGELYVVGRAKNILKYRGSTYFIEEIEMYISRLLSRKVAIVEELDKQSTFINLIIEVDKRMTKKETTEISSKAKRHTFEFCGLIVTTHCSKRRMPITTSGKLARGKLVNFLKVFCNTR